jgi:DNA primase
MNIIELLSEYNIDYRTEGHEHCRTGWVQIDCPFCSAESLRYRMGINLQYGYANCWHCGHKSLNYILVKLLKISFKAVEKLTGKIQHERIEKIKHTGTYQEPSHIGKLTLTHKQYLRSRGFNTQQIKKLWHIRALGIAPRLQWRIFIPIIYHGQRVSWTTRSLNNKQKGKYISASPEEESIPHKHLIYGEDYCRHSIVVVEGPLDVWAGGPGFGALFGLSYTSKQVERISKYNTRAICFDNQPEAKRIAKKLTNDLSVYPGETYNITLDSKDAGEAKQYELERIRKEVLE